jgi:hypothetical protein
MDETDLEPEPPQDGEVGLQGKLLDRPRDNIFNNYLTRLSGLATSS